MTAAGVESRPVWGAWIEIAPRQAAAHRPSSRPVWGAWIEMFKVGYLLGEPVVAPRMGRVD